MDPDSLNLVHFAEALFQEFSLANTSNHRKRELEQQIKSLIGNAVHWKLWIDVIPLTQNHLFLMYCLNLLNDFIANFWNLASAEQKTYIREHLLLHLTGKNQVR